MRDINKKILRIVTIVIFLYFSYDYFLRNSIDAFFTRLVQLPFIYQIVPSWIYWIIVLAVCYVIFRLYNID